MSQLGKILLYIALVGGLVAIGFGYMVIQRHNSDVGTLKQTVADLVDQRQATAKAKQETATAQDQTKQVQTQLTDTQNKVSDLTSQLSAAQAKQTELQAAVQQSADAAKKSEDELARISSVLHGSSPDEVMANLLKLNSQIAADNAEQKILQDRLQAADKQVADLKDALNRAKTGIMPPGISGKVTFVNRTWNFVVLNVGLSNGVVPNGELIVYRGRDFLGKVKVTSAEDNTCVADILPGAKADIQVGDDVLN